MAVSLVGTNGTSNDRGRERRESERAIAYWEGKRDEFGEELTLSSLDLSHSATDSWANRFLISVDPVLLRSTLVLYGRKFAQLLHLPEHANPSLPIARQLPARYTDLFLRGCTEAQPTMVPVRLEGESERYDGRIEQYRAAFIPIGIKPNALTYFAFGAFNSRVIESQGTA